MAYDSRLYIHEMDQRAMDALNAFPLFLKLRKAYSANFDEKSARIEFLSNAIRLNERQMPEVYNLLPPICEKLGIDVPELYYITSGEMNAATMGTTNPLIFVTSSICAQLPSKQLSSVLAHECGHIACRHNLYHSIAGYIANAISRGADAVAPWARNFLDPTLINAIMFWDRCSELSADRAAVLCDGEPEDMIDALLRIHGYGKNVNREEFLKQAIDLHDFIDSSNSNKMIELMLTKEDSHPRLATRVYECEAWSKSDVYQGILDGTYTAEKRKKKEEADKSEDEVLAAEVKKTEDTGKTSKAPAPASSKPYTQSELDAALEKVNAELDRHTNHADKFMYAISVFSGVMSGAIDAVFVGETVVTKGDIALSHRQVNNFIQQYAKFRGYPEDRLKDSIADLEQAFKVAQDNVWKGAGINVAAKNHHLADLAHHPTPLGLVSAIIVQFLRIGTFVNKNGEWHFIPVATTKEEMIEAIVPAVITGVLNWLVYIGERKFSDDFKYQLSPTVVKIAHLVASSTMLLEIAKCANNWFGHLVSDMGGSKNTAGGGMGIPGVFISLLHEVSSLPGFKDTELPGIVDDLYENKKIDLRHEMAYVRAAGKQVIPIAFNEIYTRILYSACMLGEEEHIHGGIKGINWKRLIPFGNRTVDRMLTISMMTFTLADTADAAVRAAVESGGNWVLFSTRFVARYNFVGAGRAAFAIVKEVSDSKKEAQLIHERLILTAAKTQDMMEQLQDYKRQVEEKLSEYIAEDTEAFLTGFDYMSQGAATRNSDLFIKGNVVIQRVLGREVQFTNQKEFDDLMDSDTPLIL